MTQQVITCLWYRVGTKCTLLCTFIENHLSVLSMSIICKMHESAEWNFICLQQCQSNKTSPSENTFAIN